MIRNYSPKLKSLAMSSETRLTGWAKQLIAPNRIDPMVYWQRKPPIAATSELGRPCDSRVELY